MDDARIGIGEAPKRVEDARLLTGTGTYIDDMVLDGMVHAAVLRSPHAHAWIRGVDASAALKLPGICAVLTGGAQTAAGIHTIPCDVPVNRRSGEPYAHLPQFPLATDRVRHVGEPVAAVVADTPEQAMDAAEAIAVDYEPMAAVTSGHAALAEGAVQLSQEIPDNLCQREQIGDEAATDEAFGRAAHVIRVAIVNHRIVTSPMEPRGAIGVFDPPSGRYTLHVSSQAVHLVRDCVTASLGVEAEDVRVVAPDVGGGFGAKNFTYPEYVLMLWAAREVGRPVKWINTRSETFAADDQARDHVSQAELALDAEGKILGLRIATTVNLGPYLRGPVGRITALQYVGLVGGMYVLPVFHADLRLAYTNVASLGVTRGPGFAEAIYLIERLMDAAARELDISPVELRRRNLIPASAMPFTNVAGSTIDTGDFAANQDAALARADVEGFAHRRRQSEERGLLRGFGIAHHMKITLGPPEENVEIRFDADDQVTLTTGTLAIGQGHETTFRQIVADRLGVPNMRVRYQAGDTDLISKGGGHGSSRATFMGGSAIHFAAQKIIDKGRRVAAHVLESAVADIEFVDGRFVISGTDRSLDIFEVARIACDPDHLPEGMESGLEAYHLVTREHGTFPNGCHAAEVEIDPETGMVSLLRYAAVDDYGVIVNPMIAEGQVHGAIAQGVGQALLEHAVYDPDSGQLLSGSFMDYALPRADDLPSFDLAFQGIPCTTNPLGVKGLGETGAIGAFPAATNAVLDALSAYGVTTLDGPATPDRIWRAIHQK